MRIFLVPSCTGSQRTLRAGLLLLLTAPGTSFGQSCPPEQPDTRVLVERFLTRPAHEISRQETGLTGVAASSIRLLTNGSDDSACQQLNAAAGTTAGQSGPWRWSYYTAGGRYFSSLHHVDDANTHRVGFVPVYVYDAQFRLLGVYAM